MLGIAVLGGCAAHRTAESPQEQLPPDWSTVRADWNARAESIESLYARGIFEARWTDDDGGDRFEQGDLDVWFLRPDRLATRVSKFGETYAVTGMNEHRHWYYLSGEERVLFVGERQSDSLKGFQSLPASPEFYRNVLGLGGFPIGGDPAITWDAAAEAWCIELRGLPMSLPSRVWIAPKATYPTRFEFVGRDPALRLLVEYDGERTRTIAIPGRPVTSHPVFANAMTISLLRGDDVESRSMVVLDRMTVDVEDEPVDRVFDLEVMQRGLAPDRVERLDAATGSSEDGP